MVAGATTGQGRGRVVAIGVALHRDLVEALGIERVETPAADDFALGEREGRLDLRPPGEADRAGVCATFPPDRDRVRGGRRPLVRAFGRRIERVLDLTAGFGADAYRLAEAGLHVVAGERDPAVFAVLASGWARDCAEGRVPEEVAARLEFRHAEGMELLRSIDAPDYGVYLDPMYPTARRGRALPRRALQVLRERQPQGEQDPAPLLEAARARAARVVVKRAHRAAPLAADPSHVLESRLVRFDVYLGAAIGADGGRAAHAGRATGSSPSSPSRGGTAPR